MASTVVEKERITVRREAEPTDGDVVVYWMQQAQRAGHNDALEYAVQQANDLGLPLAVVFCVDVTYPHASARHYLFMLEGLKDVEASLRRRSIAFTVFVSDAESVFSAIDHRVALLITDRGYLPIQEEWRQNVEKATTGPIIEIETDVVVPIDLVSDHMETAARTIRPKISNRLDHFVVKRATTAVDHKSSRGSSSTVELGRTGGAPPTLNVADPARALTKIDVDTRVDPVDSWIGGNRTARRLLREFCGSILPAYSSRRNKYDSAESGSRLSPYLHFGQVSPVEVVYVARSSDAPPDEVAAFIDEVVVRRELAINYVVHQPQHDSFAGLPEWARSTLDEHRSDERRALYSAAELEAGKTDDDVWNTIMETIRTEGWVHNQLRMYWGKQIMRWTNNPEHAYRTLLDLNNKFFLDGRDPNSFANVAWCFGRHDQGFEERDVIGKIRPFTDQALRRKGDLDAWLSANRRENDA